MPSKYSPWLEMQSFSRCIHFLKASLYTDLGTVIRYWWMADPSACRDWYFRPARNAFNFGNKKKSHGARSGEYGGRWGKTVTFSFFKNAVTIAEVWAGALSCRRRKCLKPVAGHLSDYTFSVSSVLRLCNTFRWCFCPFSLALLLRFLHQRRRLHTKPSLYSFGNYWAFAVFSGPDLIANLSDGLKIMDPGFITCDDIGKLLFVIFWKHLK